ncbi:MAG: hypothetical protein JWQ97_239 [Phenylobacterium sp.]|nr:hypothetical protein [Phenylobacterium sp.]
MGFLRYVRSSRTSAIKLAARVALGAYAGFAGLNAQAADLSVVASAFGNTVVSTYPDGRTQKIWLHPDGSWDGEARNGLALAGRWQLKGEKVCLRQSKPPTLPISFCTPFPEHTEPGVQWASHDVIGNPIQLSLQKGMPPAPVAGQQR